MPSLASANMLSWMGRRSDGKLLLHPIPSLHHFAMKLWNVFFVCLVLGTNVSLMFLLARLKVNVEITYDRKKKHYVVNFSHEKFQFTISEVLMCRSH